MSLLIKQKRKVLIKYLFRANQGNLESPRLVWYLPQYRILPSLSTLLELYNYYKSSPKKLCLVVLLLGVGVNLTLGLILPSTFNSANLIVSASNFLCQSATDTSKDIIACSTKLTLYSTSCAISCAVSCAVSSSILLKMSLQ